MREIERHIVRLLLDNDCVIVPGFGGFLAHRIPASYNKAEGIFLPPSRTIGFNPMLTMNDSLLAQAYASCYDISYPEALKHIDNDVAILKQTIEEEGELNICGLGRIVLNQSGNYDFHPDQSGFVSPDLYGLDTFEITPMAAEESMEEPQQELPNTAITMQPVITEHRSLSLWYSKLLKCLPRQIPLQKRNRKRLKRKRLPFAFLCARSSTSLLRA